MKKSLVTIIAAILLAVGLLSLGLAVRSGICSISQNQREVAVRGLSEREVKANQVTWPICYKITGNDLVDLYDQVNSNNKAVTEFLTSNGIPESEITAMAPEIVDRQANEYSNSYGPYRYIVTGVLTVCSENVDLVSQLMNRQGELLTRGVAVVANDYSNPINFNFTGLNEIKPEMIQEATKNARAAAEQFAKDSDSDLGKIKAATQGQFSIEDRDATTPTIKRVRVVTYVTYYLKD